MKDAISTKRCASAPSPSGGRGKLVGSRTTSAVEEMTIWVTDDLVFSNKSFPSKQGGTYVGPQIGMNPKLILGLPDLEY